MVKYYNKLVRSKIPQIIKDDGKTPNTKILSKEEYKEELDKKLVEEVSEYINANNEVERIAELADIKEVFEEIIFANRYDYDEIIDIQINKEYKKGDFKERTFLKSVD